MPLYFITPITEICLNISSTVCYKLHACWGYKTLSLRHNNVRKRENKMGAGGTVKYMRIHEYVYRGRP
jgi:hypothetical protein